MSDKIGVGVIGVGRFGRLHAKVYSELESAQLVAVADIDEKRAQEVGTECGAQSYVDFRPLLARDDIDAVSICTSDNLHVAPAVAAAEAKKHILVEKPLASSVADCEKIIAATEKTGVKLMVGQILRFDPRYHAARQAIVEGQIGEIVHFYARRNNVITSAQRLASTTSVLFFLGIHDIDFMNWCAQSPIERVYAETTRKVLATGADSTLALLHFTNDIIASLEISWILPKSYSGSLDARFEAVGTMGALFIDGSSQSTTIYQTDGSTCPETYYAPLVYGKTVGILQQEIAHFVECIRDDKEPFISGEDGKAAVKVAAAIAESVQKGGPVYLL